MYSMLITFLLLFLTMPSFVDVPQRDDSPVIYLLPGQGADCRLFKNIDFPYDTIHFDLEMIPGSIDLSTVTVEARQPFSAASSKAIRDFNLKIKPVRSTQHMLQLAPGLFLAQHAGGGKAEQIFMRVIDADHGTDGRITVDGMITIWGRLLSAGMILNFIRISPSG